VHEREPRDAASARGKAAGHRRAAQPILRKFLTGADAHQQDAGGLPSLQAQRDHLVCLARQLAPRSRGAELSARRTVKVGFVGNGVAGEDRNNQKVGGDVP
jgi:hypothetical protein